MQQFFCTVMDGFDEPVGKVMLPARPLKGDRVLIGRTMCLVGRVTFTPEVEGQDFVLDADDTWELD